METIDKIEAYQQSFQARLRRDFERREGLRQKAYHVMQNRLPVIIAKYQAIKSAYLFGSILRPGSFRSDSDIDLGIIGGSAEDYFALWHELTEALPEWNIDLRDLPPNTRFTECVLERGEKIYG